MPSEIAIFEERQLRPLAPQFADVLAGRMPPERLIRTIVLSVERAPKLLECNRQSLLNAGMTFGVLALEVDGVTGQGYILPFKNRAQPVIGYKGYNTLGARAKLTITGEVVREGDEFDYALGTRAFIHHKPSLKGGGRIIAAWAQAAAIDRTPVIAVLGLDDLEAVRKKSPGARMSDSPWNDPSVGLPAMYAKTAKRRLARSTPLVMAAPEFMRAAAMDEAHEERGQYSYLAPSGDVVIDGETSPLPQRQDATETPGAEQLMGPKPDAEIERLKRELDEAAEGGVDVLLTAWRRLTPRQQAALEKYKDETAKPAAIKVDAESATQENEI